MGDEECKTVVPRCYGSGSKSHNDSTKKSISRHQAFVQMAFGQFVKAYTFSRQQGMNPMNIHHTPSPYYKYYFYYIP